MSKINEEVLQKIKEVYELDKLCAADTVVKLEKGWLASTLREVKADSLAKDIIKEFRGQERAFIVALAEFLIEKKLITEPIKKPPLAEPDFIDRMQDRVI